MDQTSAGRELKDESWRALPRFLVGSTIRGAHELRRRALDWNAAMPANAVPVRSDWESGHALRWVLIGLLFESPRILHDQLLPTGLRWARWWQQRLELLARIPGGRALVQRWTALRVHVEAELIRLAEAGRIEEWRSEALAERAWRDLTSNTIATVSEATQIREVVVEQGVSLTQEAADSLRMSAASADAAVENLVHSLFHLRRRPKPPSGPTEEIG